jgi:predicted signal transduction protein with EAL and GGDEF domain
VTISAGIAIYPSHAMEMDSLMRAADRALYQSKEAGRNRLTMAGPLKRKSDATPLSLVHSAPPNGALRNAEQKRQAAAGGE